MTSTTFSIYATTIFARLASTFFPKGEKWAALCLTVLTLFFVELLPKNVGVSNAELVARRMVPPINTVATLVSPFGIALTWLSKRALLLFGLKTKSISEVSEEELRLIVSGARESGSIESTEGDMIQGVLDLQDQMVREVMRPRTSIIAIPQDMSVANVLGVIRESGYSRIPVYDGEIDNVVGIVLAKDLIDFFVGGMTVDSVRLDNVRRDKEMFEGDRGGEDRQQHNHAAADPPKTEIGGEGDKGKEPSNTFGFGGSGGSAGTEQVRRVGGWGEIRRLAINAAGSNSLTSLVGRSSEP